MNYKLLSEEFYSALRRLAFTPISNGLLDEDFKNEIGNLFRKYKRYQGIKMNTEKIIVKGKKLLKERDQLISLSGVSTELDTTKYKQTSTEFDALFAEYVGKFIDITSVKGVIRDEVETLIE